jgi:2-polyprenyl-3-methyl-5-hydroxy-6-metoxy-1,4-benzoquinol methylase
MSKKCLICSCSDFVKLYDDTLLKCKDCDFVTANLDISEEKLKQIYTENYFKGEEYLDYVRDKNVLQKNFNKRLEKINKLTQQIKIKSALEIGCAYGFFAESFTKRFLNASYVGYDIAEEAVAYGSNNLKQNVHAADYLTVLSKNTFTDVFMWDVIEHLPSPQLFIEKISSEIEQGGRIYITTGDISSALAKAQKSKWRMIHPPSHLHYFSKSTLKKLLENYGFKVIHIEYPPVYRSVSLVFYSLFILRKNPSKFITYIYNHIPKSWCFSINTMDIMFVIAEKSSR